MFIVFNKEAFALSAAALNDVAYVPVNPFVDYATKFGLFLPFNHFTGQLLLDWINSDFELDITNNALGVLENAGFLHVDNAGRTWVVQVDTVNNFITKLRYSSLEFAACSGAAQEFVYTKELLRGVTKISKACGIINERTINQIVQPAIHLVSDWVEYAKANGYKTTDIFSATRFKKLK